VKFNTSRLALLGLMTEGLTPKVENPTLEDDGVDLSKFVVLTKSWPSPPPLTTSGAMYSIVPQNE